MARLVLVEDDETPGRGVRLVLQEEPQEPLVTRLGKAIGDVPRQLGLTARYAIEGPAQAAQIVTEPIRSVMGMAGIKASPLGESASWLADQIGLPKPRDATERVAADTARLMSGAGATMGLGAAGSALPGMTGRVMQTIAANPAQQLSASVGSGVAGGAAREAGADPFTQFGASLVGGVAGSKVADAASRAGSVLSAAVRPKEVEQQVTIALQRAGVDLDGLPAAAQAALRQEVAQALRTGRDVSPAALSRLADFRALGVTPTRGMISQDPVQITREQNLSRIAANSSDQGLHSLPMTMNRNNARLIDVMNEAGAGNGDPYRAGQVFSETIRNRDQELANNVTGLYTRAREMFGGQIPINRADIIEAIHRNLSDKNVNAFLPDKLRSHINEIASGKGEFTTDSITQLMKVVSNVRAADGNERAAIQAVRDALLQTPLTPLKNEFGGGQMVTGAMAGALREADDAPSRVREAINQARAAAKGRFDWQESARPIEAVINGAEPDKIFRKFVLSGDVADAEAIARSAAAPEMKAAIVDFLKARALNGASDETGKFSQAAFRKAMDSIGERKLGLFFEPEEMQQLRRIARVSSLMMTQPVGSAVNNSNSGTTLLGRGYDGLKWLADKVPFGRAAILDPINGIEVAIRQRNAANVVPGLLAPDEEIAMLQRLISPTIAAGGLLAAP